MYLLFIVSCLLICYGSAALPTLQPVVDDALDHQSILCANDKTPVCARSSSNEYLMFKNECHLHKTKRENLLGPLFDVALRFCVPSCEFSCDDDQEPVCGVSVDSGESRTFQSRCEMARSSCSGKTDWLLYKSGVCPPVEQETPQHSVIVGQSKLKTKSKSKSRQPIRCTNVYRPVCAIYAGVKSSFANECMLTAENIRTGRNWRLVSEGVCGEDSLKMKDTLKTTPKPKEHKKRSKRSYGHQELDANDDVVQIYAPSTFHTEFISQTGSLESSYSLQPHKAYIANRPSIKTSKLCVFSNEPVCGTFNGESRNFTNVCKLMEYSQQVGNAWTILHDGICRNCDVPCPTDYNPICVSRNGIEITINNKCFLERVRCKDLNSDWKITHVGECVHDAEEVPESPVTNRVVIPPMLYADKIVGLKDTAAELLSKDIEFVFPLAVGTTTEATETTPGLQLGKVMRKPGTFKDLRKIKLALAAGNEHELKEDVPSDNWLVAKTMENIKEMFVKKPNNKKQLKIKKLAAIQLPATTTTMAAPTVESHRTTTTTSSATTPAIAITTSEMVMVKKAREVQFKTAPTNIEQAITTQRTDQSEETKTAETSTMQSTTSTLASTSPTKGVASAEEILATTASAEATTKSAPLQSTPNLDYVADEMLPEPSQQKSIYGLNKNSLIMRLLRARSGDKNVVI